MTAAFAASSTRVELLIHSATVADVDGERADAWIAVAGGVIVATGRGSGWRGITADETVDAAASLVVPGFVDLHVHGGGGHAHEDGAGGIRAAVATHRAHGTTRTVVSFVSGAVDELIARLAEVAVLAATDETILGSHLEGPFLALARRGAHAPERLVDPVHADVDRLIRAAAGTLRQVTIDPLRQGAVAAIELLDAAGVTVAVGHTEAGYAATRDAFERGARLVTHAFNAMPGIHHRDPGPLLAAIEDERVVLEFILDGEHVHPAVAALLFREAPDRVALITDAMAAAAAPDGDYLLGELAVSVADGRAVIAGTDTLAGSTLTLDRALRVGRAAGIPLPVLLGALSATPARVLGLDDVLGRIAPGYAADLVFLDEALAIERVTLGGLAAARAARASNAELVR